MLGPRSILSSRTKCSLLKDDDGLKSNRKEGRTDDWRNRGLFSPLFRKIKNMEKVERRRNGRHQYKRDSATDLAGFPADEHY